MTLALTRAFAAAPTAPPPLAPNAAGAGRDAAFAGWVDRFDAKTARPSSSADPVPESGDSRRERREEAQASPNAAISPLAASAEALAALAEFNANPPAPPRHGEEPKPIEVGPAQPRNAASAVLAGADRASPAVGAPRDAADPLRTAETEAPTALGEVRVCAQRRYVAVAAMRPGSPGDRAFSPSPPESPDAAPTGAPGPAADRPLVLATRLPASGATVRQPGSSDPAHPSPGGSLAAARPSGRDAHGAARREAEGSPQAVAPDRAPEAARPSAHAPAAQTPALATASALPQLPMVRRLADPIASDAGAIASDAGAIAARHRPADAADAEASSAARAVKEIDLEIADRDLGPITVTMRKAGDRLSLAIKVASAGALSRIESERDSIVHRLAAVDQPLASLTIERSHAVDPQTPASRDGAGDHGRQEPKPEGAAGRQAAPERRDPPQADRGGARRNAAGDLLL